MTTARLSKADEERVRTGPLTTVIGRCDNCRKAIRLDVAPITLLDDDDPYGLDYLHGRHPETEGRRWVGTLSWLSDRAPYKNRPRCSCGSLYLFGVLRGQRTSTPCSSACTGAISFDCKCQCGGANHGTEAA